MRTSIEARFFFLFIFWVAVELSCARLNENYENGSKLLKSLFDEGYDSQVRPYYKERKVNVTAGIFIVAFSSVKELDMEYSMDMYFSQSWIDPRLKHDDHGEAVIVKEDNIYKAWLPDTYFLNMKKATELKIPSKSKKLVINSKGEVTFSMRLGVTASCDMNFIRYPMDSQSCKLILLSYSHDITKLDYTWQNQEPVVVQDPELSEYEIKKTETRRVETRYTTGVYTHLEVEFLFKRRIEYSILHIYAPTFFIVCISWIAFWISKDAAPARVALGVTTILTIVTLIGSVRSYVPRVSYIKAVDYYLIVSFCFVFGSMLEYVLVLMHDASVRGNYIDDKAEEICIDIPLEEMNGTGSPESTQKVSQRTSSGRRRLRTMHGSARRFLKYVYFTKNTDKVDRVARYVIPMSYIIFNVVYMIACGASPVAKD